MIRTVVPIVVALALQCAWAGAEVFLGSEVSPQTLGIVQNPRFERGGASYADNWRPLPGGVRMHRAKRETGEKSLFMGLRNAGDGGVIQVVDLPARRRLSLQILATCWSSDSCSVVASLVRRSDGVVLTEVVVDGIERGVMAENFQTGAGGPAELMIRLVGATGGEALIDAVTIGPPVEAPRARLPDFTGGDLVLAPGCGLRVDADFEPRLLPQAARMLQEAIEDLTGSSTEGVGATVSVSVDRPEATDWPARESYHLTVSGDGVRIEAPAERGAVWGMMTLIDLIRPEPGGGARILAVDVRDEPALPLRIARGVRDEDPLNFARAAARLKFNVTDVGPPVPDTPAIVRELKSLGIEPLVRIHAKQDEDVIAAMQDAIDELGARYLLVSPPRTDGESDGDIRPHRWGEPPLSEVARFAREHAREVTVIVPAYRAILTAKRLGTLRQRLATTITVTPDNWPTGVVALLPSVGRQEDSFDHQGWLDAGIPCVLNSASADEPLSVARALKARANGRDCRGVLVRPRICGGSVWEREFTRRAADLAWRGLPGGE